MKAYPYGAAKENRRIPRSHMKLIRMRTSDKKAKTFRFDTGSKNIIIVALPFSYQLSFLFEFAALFFFNYTELFF